MTRTRSPSRQTIIRNPSCLISCKPDRRKEQDAVRRERWERDEFGNRSAAELEELRELAIQSATVCAGCFSPIAPGAS
jgi:hypothetical protein